MLAEYLAKPEMRTVATMFYGATQVFNSFTYNLFWRPGYRQPELLAPNPHPRGMRTTNRRYRLELLCYALATRLALLNAWLSLAIHLTLALWNAVSERKE
ncbi:hypothetical protein [Chromobacterium sphagni]|uniref:Uncharacterized protein n=1 Tax=Chromobacterium sphagni TaxID=1903179 RepID=A0ABX3C713_9NEIS|nr:hypothetical protein [Chromobacterium sphagni]OHX15539.1 hypothetical protein BI344_22080 [Chromobacterium sphagni]